jgi:flagellar hook-associated protein FlgK
MDLGSALSIASSGLNGIEYQYSVVAQNVANSSTTGYAAESASVTSAVAGNQGTGVRIGKTVVNVSPFLQSSLYTQNAKVSAPDILLQFAGRGCIRSGVHLRHIGTDPDPVG